MHGGNYGSGNVVYAGCAPALSLPENTDLAFCFFELFENLFSGIALIRCGKISFMTCKKFGNIFACRKTEPGDKPFAGHVPVELTTFCCRIWVPVSEEIGSFSEMILGSER